MKTLNTILHDKRAVHAARSGQKMGASLSALTVDCFARRAVDPRWQLIDESKTPTVACRADDGAIVHCNAAWSEMCQYSKDEAVGRTNKELLQGEATDRDAARSMVAELRRASRSRRVLLNYKKDGTAFWNDVVVQHLGDEQSSARGLGIDLAFLREAKHATDVDASHGRADAFRATRKLAPFHGELAEGTLCPAA